MEHTAKYYENKLQELNSTMYVSLDNLKNSYPLYKTFGTPEYNTIYSNDSANVETIFHKLYELRNQLIKESQQLSKTMEQKNYIIEMSKKNFKKQKYKFQQEDIITLAAKPRGQDYKNQLSNTYHMTGLLSVGILTAIFICYKQKF